MTTARKKVIVAGLGLVVALGYLAFVGVESGWVYFIDVDQYVGNDEFRTQRVRLHGKVAVDDFSAANLKAQFTLLGKTDKVRVAYQGIIPDMFQAGRDVVVEGKLDSDGIFRAEVLMTKCASKYEPESPHANVEGSR